MADQNQIPGSLRTLKTDLETTDMNPQDRLQQAGNFMQARPKVDDSTPKPDEAAMQDAEPKVSSNYSWTNMDIVPTKLNDSSPKLPIQTSPEDKSKSKFSVLDDSIDFPVDNNTGPSLSANVSSSTDKNTEFKLENSTNLPLEDNTPNVSPSLGTDLNVVNDQIESFSPPTDDTNIADTTNNQFDIDSLDLQDDIKDVKQKSSNKGLLSIGIVLILLSLIGGGVYFYFNIDSNTNTEDTNNVSTASPTPVQTPQASSSSFPLLVDSTVNIVFSDSEPIRKTISTILTDKKDTLIELNFTKDNNPVGLVDIVDALGFTIPSINTIESYKFYAYNQQGVYKLISVLGLPGAEDAKTFIDNWSSAIPRDLAAFSITLPSRIVNTPQIKKSSITNVNGKEFENYYYNYTSSADSIDVSSYTNYVLIASSQESMLYTLDQIK